MYLVKLPDELNIFSKYLHLEGFSPAVCVLSLWSNFNHLVGPLFGEINDWLTFQ